MLIHTSAHFLSHHQTYDINSGYSRPSRHTKDTLSHLRYTQHVLTLCVCSCVLMFVSLSSVITFRLTTRIWQQMVRYKRPLYIHLPVIVLLKVELHNSKVMMMTMKYRYYQCILVRWDEGYDSRALIAYLRKIGLSASELKKTTKEREAAAESVSSWIWQASRPQK